MLSLRRAAFVLVTAIVLFGTAYSVVHDTYLDTSDPLITHSHHLSSSHYFATKSNFLNVYFIKKTWGWTTLLFFLSWITSPPNTHTGQRLVKWIIATSVWAAFTMWFFGPPLFDRIIVASGGACIVNIPSGGPVTLPTDYCIDRIAVSPSSHPQFFAHITDFVPPSLSWKALPRLRKGHDVSGHIFLLTLSTLFLADQITPSLNALTWSLTHRITVCANLLLIGIWLFASGTTSVYYHSPFEKATGCLLGVAGFLLTQLPFWNKPVKSAAHTD